MHFAHPYGSVGAILFAMLMMTIGAIGSAFRGDSK